MTAWNFDGKDLKKRWEAIAGTPELSLHFAGVSEELIRRAITVSLRRLTQKDYDCISSVIQQFPLVHFSTSTEELQLYRCTPRGHHTVNPSSLLQQCKELLSPRQK